MPSIEVDIDTDDQNDLGDIEADETARHEFQNDYLLDKFRSQMLPSFPFMHLPDTITAQTLETEWPVLFSAVVFVASASAGKGGRGRIMKRLICESLLDFDHTPTNMKRIGLLLAILTYLTWGYDHIFYNDSMPRLTTQAVSLATEIIQSDYADSGSLMEPAAQLFGHDRLRDASATTRHDFLLDRRRAILGCFVLNSAVSTYFGRINTFQWTTQMEESLAAIRANKDCPSDGEFSLLIRLQLVGEKASQVLLRQKMKHQNSIGEAATSPGIVSLMSLRSELQGLGSALPPQVADRRMVMAQVYSTESQLGKITHAISSTVPVMTNQFERMLASMSAGESTVDDTSKTKTARSDQIINLWQCLQSSRNCVLALLDWESGKFCHMSFLQWSQLAQSVAFLHHLTHTIEDQGWDRETVRARVHMPEILDCIIKKLQSVTETSEPGDCGNTVSHLIQKMIELRTSVTDHDTKQHTTQREADAAWERLQTNEGGRGASPCDVTRLDDTFRRTRGPFDYVFE
ncbi:hypothetical protein LEL_04702 [Akanthomyces lecanii RCEF 1005]|uniref:Fungal transcriptional regulatory protein n=1 Tax=Akanthomyces lecanii RCEF 1005 TaxID=1081108 RepID=A0A168HK08_CORDF|nr:hypothetical protein LEL_04702 [Akanthomyces lecanii RCEF 1005]